MRNEISAQHLLTALIGGALKSADHFILDGAFHDEIGPLVEQDTQAAKSPEQVVHELAGPKDLLDFGCGPGAHRPWLTGLGYRWQGVNYREGMASGAAKQAESEGLSFYDGLHLPYADASFDVVWSFQVFEHIQDPQQTFAEIARVLRPGGALVGAVSYLEQFHDYSTFNFTPYGFKLSCDRAGLAAHRLYPRIDAFSWLLHRLLVVTSGTDENSVIGTLGPDNEIQQMFEAYGRRMGQSDKNINLMRLMFCSHFTFHAVKPA